MHKVTNFLILLAVIWLSSVSITNAFWWLDYSSRHTPTVDHPSGSNVPSAEDPLSKEEVRTKAGDPAGEDSEGITEKKMRSRNSKRRDQGRGRGSVSSPDHQAASSTNSQSSRASVDDQQQESVADSPQEQSRHPVHPSRGGQTGRFPVPSSPNDLFSNEPSGCSCSCSNYGAATSAPNKESCQWVLIFKAVAGTRQNVYDDWMNGGNINYGDPEAMTTTSPLPYRDGYTIMHWNYEYINWVKIELFKNGVREMFFYFDGTASDTQSWFSPRRLLKTIDDDLIGDELDVFSIEGEPFYGRRFMINEESPSCEDKSGYLMVIDSGSGGTCDFDDYAEKPYFLYTYDGNADDWSDYPGDIRIGDRFLISVQICDRGL